MDDKKILTPKEQIAILAHRIYEEEGCLPGRERVHWNRAEHIIREQRLGVDTSQQKNISIKNLKK